MLSRFALFAAALTAAGGAMAAPACDPVFMQQYRQCALFVETLRPEKSGQARVFASDGSEFTAGQAVWMQGQLRKVEKLCALGTRESRAAATQTLAEIQDLVRTHQHLSS